MLYGVTIRAGIFETGFGAIRSGLGLFSDEESSGKKESAFPSIVAGTVARKHTSYCACGHCGNDKLKI